MQFSTFTWFLTATLAGHALAMPRGGGGGSNAAANNDNANGNGNSNAAAASGASTDGQTCEGGTGNILDTGVCKNGKCNIEIPPNEVSIVARADCE
ncbi:hypothetical protein INS49_013644 [Diaporthe citri]|uniref:uncharacterized protein n=1 Tax=Diaporthe citri TaxID=83186 RepID=UPI001C7F1E98|nr:uncharacterized protein INS49_013644 [Diaporthe citri]KAG6357765.1 hypothetical protein INS49_013644 [Diaporthe citri]